MDIRQIALPFAITVGYEEELVLGVERYAQRHEPWSLLAGPEQFSTSIYDLKGWPGDGVIAAIRTPAEAAFARTLGIPVVDVAGTLADSGHPQVGSDQQMIGRLAAEHLLACGLRDFAYYGLQECHFSARRGKEFAARVQRAGHSCARLETAGRLRRRRGWHYWLDEMCQWLTTLPRPLGLMAVDDSRARLVVDSCRLLGLRVPYDVAVVGVDNNRIACEGARPMLSTVAHNALEVGYQAARLLDRLMSGREWPADNVRVPPVGVIARESTDLAVGADPELGAAVRFLREHLGEPVTVDDLLRAVAVSRRWLERRFQERFSRTPFAYLCEMRVERAKGLLLRPQPLDLAHVARACGFSSERNLAAVFRRVTGVAPREYRRSQRREEEARGMGP